MTYCCSLTKIDAHIDKLTLLNMEIISNANQQVSTHILMARTCKNQVHTTSLNLFFLNLNRFGSASFVYVLGRFSSRLMNKCLKS